MRRWEISLNLLISKPLVDFKTESHDQNQEESFSLNFPRADDQVQNSINLSYSPHSVRFWLDSSERIA